MKKLLTIAMTATLILSLAACSTKTADTTDSTPTSDSVIADSSQIANPWTAFDSLEEAAQQAGFKLTVPDQLEGYSEITYQVLEGDETTATLLEVLYSNEEANLSIRKAAGSEDISGDYNTYDFSTTETLGENEVTMQGIEEGTVNLATWTAGDYTYAVSAASGISVQECTELVAEVQ